MKKKVIVLGASENPSRYSHRAIIKLTEKGFDPIPISNRPGEINGIQFMHEWPENMAIYAVTIYLNAKNQIEHYDKILSSEGSRIIFNPGAENKELLQKCYQNKIVASDACSLVLLSLGEF